MSLGDKIPRPVAGPKGFAPCWQAVPLPSLSAPGIPMVQEAKDPADPLMVAWNAVKDAETYTIQAATDIGFTQDVLQQDGLNDARTGLSGLLPGEVYWCRVKAAAGTHESVWSPLGQFVTPGTAPQYKIVFSAPASGGSELFSVNSDGTGLQQITFTGQSADEPAISPDGKMLAYSTAAGVYAYSRAIWVMPVDGGEPVALVSGDMKGRQPAWSPDGTKIAYIGQGKAADSLGLYVMDADGKNPVQYTRPGKTGFMGSETDPAWSKDGKTIYVASNRDAKTTGDSAIYRIPANGVGGLAMLPIPTVIFGDNLYCVPKAAGDQRLLINVCSSSPSDGNLAAVKLTTNTIELLIQQPFMHPSLSPDGRLLAADGLRVARIDGSDNHQLLVKGTNPCWIAARPLLAPELAAPADREVDFPTGPARFFWSVAPGAACYTLQISLDSTFKTPFILRDNLTSPSFQVDWLPPFTQVYWRVKASSAWGESPWSAARMLQTAPIATPARANGPIVISSGAELSLLDPATAQITPTGIQSNMEIDNFHWSPDGGQLTFRVKDRMGNQGLYQGFYTMNMGDQSIRRWDAPMDFTKQTTSNLYTHQVGYTPDGSSLLIWGENASTPSFIWPVGSQEFLTIPTSAKDYSPGFSTAAGFPALTADPFTPIPEAARRPA